MIESAQKRGLMLVGWREWVLLPELNLAPIKAKIDTGAKTSALHGWHIEPFRRKGAPWVRFEFHESRPGSRGLQAVQCEAQAIDEREIRNSGGQVERRFVIETMLKLGDKLWRIELALTNRDQMGHRMLLGRSALDGRAIVEPSRSYILGTKRQTGRPISKEFKNEKSPFLP
jgi:hypothetical protein